MRLKLKNGIVLKFRVSKKMLRDYAECKRLADERDCDGKDCEECSLDIGIGATSLCEIPEVSEILDRRNRTCFRR